MKKIFYFLTLTFTTFIGFSQNNEIHNAKVIGSFELGNQEVTTIYDETTQCQRKTSPHSKNLFIPNENVQIKISDNKNVAEVLKPSLPESVYTNKKCGFTVANTENPFDYLGKAHNDNLIAFYNDIVLTSTEPLTSEDVYVYFNSTEEEIQRQELTVGLTNVNKENYNNTIQELYDKHPLVFKKYYQMRKIVDNESLSFEKKIEKFKQIEKFLLNNPPLEFFGECPLESIEGLKSSLLVTCATARYSLYLWTPVSKGGLGYEGGFPPTVSGKPPKWVKDDIWGVATSALMTWNPWAAFGGGILASAVSAWT